MESKKKKNAYDSMFNIHRNLKNCYFCKTKINQKY